MIRRALYQIAILLLLALVPAAVSALAHPRKPRWEPLRTRLEIEASEARALKGPVLWIDARSKLFYENAHIPGALPLDQEEWEALLPAVLGKWKPGMAVIVYCSGTTCDASREVARRLREEAGMTNVSVLKGGWEAWLSKKN